jgi:hypothetical protein
MRSIVARSDRLLEYERRAEQEICDKLACMDYSRGSFLPKALGLHPNLQGRLLHGAWGRLDLESCEVKLSVFIDDTWGEPLRDDGLSPAGLEPWFGTGEINGKAFCQLMGPSPASIIDMFLKRLAKISSLAHRKPKPMDRIPASMTREELEVLKIDPDPRVRRLAEMLSSSWDAIKRIGACDHVRGQRERRDDVLVDVCVRCGGGRPVEEGS